MYTGKEDTIVGGVGHTTKVVRHLLRNYFGIGHSIYMDNFYNTYTLASKLLAEKTYCTGTLRADRKFVPPEVKSKNLQKGESVAQYANGVMVGKWRDCHGFVNGT